MTPSEQDLLVVSSRNRHKLAELTALLGGLPVRVVSAADTGVPEVDETGDTFEDNALLKAAAAFAHTGALALADDSGLVVPALGGAPGVHSARYAGPGASDDDNNRRLLRELGGVTGSGRAAEFVSCLVLVVPEARAVTAPPGAAWRRVTRPDLPAGAAMFTIEGRCPGVLLDAYRGEGGFGYDPLFLFEPLGQTFAEISAADKNRVSHRARAFEGLRSCLEAVFSAT